MPSSVLEKINNKIELLPSSPGVYIMLDNLGCVIYVGKAKNLKNRVRQYFYKNVSTIKTATLVQNICDFNYILAASESDALSLENNLIKKHKPKYNILLKDDKSYPYLRINLKEKFPRFTISRSVKSDGARYFGPYMAGVSVKEILSIIEHAFTLRSCKVMAKKECLDYHIGKCAAPCVKKISQEDYAKNVKRAIDFLSGHDDTAQQVLKQKMQDYAAREEFELALLYRDRQNVLSKITEKKITSLGNLLNADVVAITGNSIYLSASVLITRGGRMQGAKQFAIKSVYENDNEALTAFLMQFYSKNQLPDQIITHTFVEKELLVEYFKNYSSKAVKIVTPKQGAKAELFNMAKNNAQEYLEKQIGRINLKDQMTKLACKRLQDVLGLKKYPRRMECYDISNISGTDKVGAMVVFIDGEPERTEYRRFKIKTVQGADDYASIQEVLARRTASLTLNTQTHLMPDLIVIDGGLGQLSSAHKIILNSAACDVDVISLAEKNEEIYTLKSSMPIVLAKSDYALRLLQCIRDEAHRFAITYHRSIRSKRTLTSVLMQIKGVGNVKRKALLEHFKSIDNILSASLQEIANVQGIGLNLAENIKKFFKEGLNNK